MRGSGWIDVGGDPGDAGCMKSQGGGSIMTNENLRQNGERISESQRNTVCPDP